MGDRTVWATGSNEYGRLGDGTTVNRSNPVQVVGQLWKSIQWSGGYLNRSVPQHLFLKVMAPSGLPVITNTVRLGMELLSIEMFRSRQWMPLVIHLLKLFRFPGCGGAHTLFLESSGTVWASGLNDRGQLGDGTTTERRNPVRVMDGSGNPLSGVRGISAGEYHSVFLRGRHRLDGWKKWIPDNLGMGSTLDKSVPVQVVDGSFNPLGVVAEISAGRSYTCF